MGVFRFNFRVHNITEGQARRIMSVVILVLDIINDFLGRLGVTLDGGFVEIKEEEV